MEWKDSPHTHTKAEWTRLDYSIATMSWLLGYGLCEVWEKQAVGSSLLRKAIHKVIWDYQINPPAYTHTHTHTTFDRTSKVCVQAKARLSTCILHAKEEEVVPEGCGPA